MATNRTWRVDSEGVYLCPACWPELDDAHHWLDVEPPDGGSCETCSRPGEYLAVVPESPEVE